MNTTTRTILAIGLLGSVLAISSCSSDAGGEPEEALSSPTAPSAAEPTETSSESTTEGPSDESPLSADQVVEIRTYSGTYIAPSTEGGVITVEDPAVSEIPAQWAIVPVEPGSELYQLMTVALTDGHASCLTVPVGGDVSLAKCDAADPGQVLQVRSLDSPEQVSLSSSAGYIGVEPDDNTLTVFPTGDQLSSTLTLVTK
ncbi:hypothetical protein [Pengzhenrongella sicca]|uniref:Uncharacterized protein n=1 Tax=Pengzhenrongella sicca TaxID=2819238 RepID=A0A8A4ZBI3_9MICO|nr:hypothetical protein [Pengzhenrongella sicca]QTE28369.1 hypothetical protein J4E96_13395 [Pengzhenrongella sicca]